MNKVFFIIFCSLFLLSCKTSQISELEYDLDFFFSDTINNIPKDRSIYNINVDNYKLEIRMECGMIFDEVAGSFLEDGIGYDFYIKYAGSDKSLDVNKLINKIANDVNDYLIRNPYYYYYEINTDNLEVKFSNINCFDGDYNSTFEYEGQVNRYIRTDKKLSDYYKSKLEETRIHIRNYEFRKEKYFPTINLINK